MGFIQMNNIHKTFGKDDASVHALKGVSVEIKEKEMLAIMGKSGSGKSTLLNILGGLMTMDEGEILYNDEVLEFHKNKKLVEYRRDLVGFVVQYFALVEDLNVYENVALPLRYKGLSRKQIKEKVTNVLKELGIEDKIKAYPSQLSGGQQQRVSIARAIVKEPKLILADEPTGALDEATGNDVISILQKLRDKGTSVVVVTHDRRVAESCDRIVELKDGMVVKG